MRNVAIAVHSFPVLTHWFKLYFWFIRKANQHYPIEALRKFKTVMLYAVEALPQFKTKTERNSRSFFFFHLFARADPVVMVLVAGVEYGCVYNVM